MNPDTTVGSVAYGRGPAGRISPQEVKNILNNNKPYMQSVTKIALYMTVVIGLLGLATIGVNAAAVGGHLSASQVGMINLALSGAILLTIGSAFLATHFSAKKNNVPPNVRAIQDCVLKCCFAAFFISAAYSVVPASLGIAGKLSANTIGWIALAPYMLSIGGGLCCVSSVFLCCPGSSQQTSEETKLVLKALTKGLQNAGSGGDGLDETGGVVEEEDSPTAGAGGGGGGGGPGGGVGAADDGVPDAAVEPDSGDPAKNIEEPR